MAMAFFKWLGSEYMGQALISGIGRAFNAIAGNKVVQEKVADAVNKTSDHFLRNPDADEQLYLAACKTPPMTPELFKILESRRHKFPAKHRVKMCDQFNKFVAQSKFDGDKKVRDVQATAEVLKLVAETDEQTWKHLVDNLGLKTPIEVGKVLVLIRRNGNSLKSAVARQRERFDKWADDNLPAAQAQSRLARRRLEQYKRKQTANEPLERQSRWWDLR